MIVLVELHRDMLQVGGTFGTQVDNDVEDPAASTTHKLGLSCPRKLEVHAADCALPYVVGDIRLSDDAASARAL